MCDLAFCLFAVMQTLAVAETTPLRSGQVQENIPKHGCGPNALAVAARLLDDPVSDDELARGFSDHLYRVTSLGDIDRAARDCGLHTRFVKLDPRAPHLVPVPLIVRVKKDKSSANSGHFVVLFGGDAEQVQFIDYPGRPGFISVDSLAKSWGGYGLYIADSDELLARCPGAGFRVQWSFGVAWIVLALSVIGGVHSLCRYRAMAHRVPTRIN